MTLNRVVALYQYVIFFGRYMATARTRPLCKAIVSHFVLSALLLQLAKAGRRK